MSKKGSGFTLVELLVVIAIIGVLVALLLPAIQAAREAARRSQCVNNLKQLGLAMQNYHDTYKMLPKGNVSCCWGTWQMSILPFIEQAQLADMYQFIPKSYTTAHPDPYRYDSESTAVTPRVNNLSVVKTRIPTLTCPSDEQQTVHDITYHNYVANYGTTNHDGKDHLLSSSSAFVKYFAGPFVGNDENTNPHPKIERRFREISDGLSNTMLASETVQGQNGDYRGLTWWGWSAGFESRFGPNTTSPDTLQQEPYCKSEEPNPPCISVYTLYNRFWAAARSRHPGGVNVAMCDGSVHFASDSVDLLAWRAVSTMQEEDLVQSFWQ